MVAAAVVLVGCTGVQDDPEVRPSVGVHTPVPFDLYTHCGIHELQVDGRFFVRVGGRLTDGDGNPPEGWDNPSQSGHLVVDGDVAVFTDAVGHREEFEVREDATGFLAICS